MKTRDDRLIELIEEFWEELDDDMVTENTGRLLHQMAIRCLEHEDEERAAVLALLDQMKSPPTVRDLIANGTHRMRSSIVMAAIKGVQPKVDNERKKYVDEVVKNYVKEG